MDQAVVVALISGCVTLLGVLLANYFGGRNERKKHQMERQDAKEDRAALNTEKRLAEIEAKTDAQSEALRYLMYDRIRYLGRHYISEGSIDFDDRRILNEMHRSYHSGLGGNGDLNTLMEAVNQLPLK